MGLFKSVSSDMLNTQLEKIEEAVKTAESATGHFVYNLCSQNLRAENKSYSRPLRSHEYRQYACLYVKPNGREEIAQAQQIANAKILQAKDAFQKFERMRNQQSMWQKMSTNYSEIISWWTNRFEQTCSTFNSMVHILDNAILLPLTK
ncbi:hypothetical protein I150019B4_13880 [Alistipes putredinis]|jgi:hypothetical protein